MVTVGDKPDVGVERPARPVAPAPPLPYERGVTVSVRGVRVLVALTLVNTVLLASIVLGPQLSPFVRQHWQQWKVAREQRRRQAAEVAAQQKCQAHAAAADLVAYEEDPDKALDLIKASPRAYEPVLSGQREAPPGFVGPVRLRPPDYFDEYMPAVRGSARARGRYQSLVFLHGLKNPAGEPFVVAVWLNAYQSFSRGTDYDPALQSSVVGFRSEKQRVLVAEWWPAGPGAPSTSANGKGQRRDLRLSLPDHENRVVAKVKADAPLDPPPPIDYGNRLSIYAGQADSADPSHFTIPYQIDGRAGTIDGWLRNEGMELKPREGSLVFEPNQGEAWRLPATPPVTGQ